MTIEEKIKNLDDNIVFAYLDKCIDDVRRVRAKLTEHYIQIDDCLEDLLSSLIDFKNLKINYYNILEIKNLLSRIEKLVE